jgi:hypothetical protein
MHPRFQEEISKLSDMIIRNLQFKHISFINGIVKRHMLLRKCLFKQMLCNACPHLNIPLPISVRLSAKISSTLHIRLEFRTWKSQILCVAKIFLAMTSEHLDVYGH